MLMQPLGRDRQAQLLSAPQVFSTAAVSATTEVMPVSSSFSAENSAQSLVHARKLAVAKLVVGSCGGGGGSGGGTAFSLATTSSREQAIRDRQKREASLARRSLPELQREAESAGLSKHLILPLVAAASIPRPLKEWSASDVASWLAAMPYSSAAVREAALAWDVDGELLQTLGQTDFKGERRPRLI